MIFDGQIVSRKITGRCQNSDFEAVQLKIEIARSQIDTHFGYQEFIRQHDSIMIQSTLKDNV